MRMARSPLGALLLLACTAAAIAQTPAAPDGFAVASIRPNRSGGVFTAETVPRVAVQPGGRVTARNSSLRELLVVAYGLLDYQVVDGPGWIESDRFDVDARAERELSPDEARSMLRTLLADRFALKVHTESRSLPIYALVPARDDRTFGPQIRRAAETCAKPVPPAGLPPIPPPPPPPAGQQMTLLTVRWPRRCPSLMAPGFLSMRDMSMDELAARLPAFTGRTVVNQTGWTGQFDFELQFMPEFLPVGVNGSAVASAPSLFTAVREQLGLRLDSRRGPVDVLIVDSLERPTEN
jgi:uncharacterized protein (TIGR03435 family)